MPAANRDKVQNVVRAAAISNFNHYLKGATKALDDITTEGMTPFLSDEINKVEVRSK